jgi:hypothetical protein
MSDPVPTEGDFSFLPEGSIRMAYEDMWAAINAAKAWEFIKADPGPGGFMFGSGDKLKEIRHIVNRNDRVGHSGASMACFLRAMQYLAQIGWAQFVKEIISGKVNPV